MDAILTARCRDRNVVTFCGAWFGVLLVSTLRFFTRHEKRIWNGACSNDLSCRRYIIYRLPSARWRTLFSSMLASADATIATRHDRGVLRSRSLLEGHLQRRF